jgi:hypothetical protein
MSLKFERLMMVSLAAILLMSCASGPAQVLKPQPQPAESGGEQASVYDALPENVDKYMTLLGIKKSKVLEMFDETPLVLFDSGLEFKKSKVQIWFNDKNDRAIRVLLTSKEVDFNGVRIGAQMDAFDTAFGEVKVNPVEGFGDYLHEGYLVRVNYDAASGKAESVYLMPNSD